MHHLVLVSFCNIPFRTTSPLLCLEIPENLDEPVFCTPVSLGYPGLLFGATGVTSLNGKIFVLFTTQNFKTFIAVLQEDTLSSLYYQELPEVVDGHSILAFGNSLYVVSTGTDEVVCYDIYEEGLGNPTVFWRASDTKTDTHHIN